MKYCPQCRKPSLIEVRPEESKTQACLSCLGSWIPFQVLPRYVQSRHAVQIVQNAKVQSNPGKRVCPNCTKKMTGIHEKSRVGTYDLDVCVPCNGVWFDRGELEAAPHTPDFSGVEARFQNVYDLLGSRLSNRLFLAALIGRRTHSREWGLILALWRW